MAFCVVRSYVLLSYPSLRQSIRNRNKVPLPTSSKEHVNETSMQPGACGVLYYYHIAKNGGNYIGNWGRRVADENPERVQYMEYYEISDGRDYTRHPWKVKLAEMDSIVKSGVLSSQNRWLLVHHHHRYPGLRYNADIATMAKDA